MFSNFLKNGMGMSLVRHALTWGSGVLVAQGTISSDMATQIVSLAVGAAGLLLSAQDKTTKVAQFSGLEKTVTELTEKEKQERTDWLNVQRELGELRAENKQQREQLETPVVTATLEQRVEDIRRQRPQARYEQVSLVKNSGFMLSDKSRQKLVGVNPLLAQIVETAMGMSAVDFTVTEGVRSEARQKELLDAGRSWVKTSKHQVDPVTNLGHAVDVMALPTPNGSWDWEYYEQINDAMQQAAKIHNARVTWGGCWAVRDGCHFQLDGETKSA